MPQLVIDKQYADLLEFTNEAVLDAAFASITELFNTTGLDAENLQDQGITAAELQTSSVTTSKLSSSSVSSLKFGDGAVTLAKVAASLQAYLVPTGMVMPYCGVIAPTGWKLCDGSAISRTTYLDLYTLIGVTHGQGDASTTFNLPDLRGRFVRGWDNTAGVDPDKASRTAPGTGGATGNAVGSVQDDDIKAVDLRFDFRNEASDLLTPVYGTIRPYASIIAATSDGGVAGGFSTTNGTQGLESRPKNVYLNYIIKT